MEKVSAYKCSTCNMTSLYQSSVRRHEHNGCWKINSCASCSNYSKHWYPTDFPGQPSISLQCEIHGELDYRRKNCPDWQPRKAKEETDGK